MIENWWVRARWTTKIFEGREVFGYFLVLHSGFPFRNAPSLDRVWGARRTVVKKPTKVPGAGHMVAFGEAFDFPILDDASWANARVSFDVSCFTHLNRSAPRTNPL